MTDWHAVAIEMATSTPSMTLQEIADVVGKTKQRVGQVLAANGIKKPRSPRGRLKGPTATKTCEICNVQYEAPRSSERAMCSHGCRLISKRALAYAAGLPEIYKRVAELHASGFNASQMAVATGSSIYYVNRITRELGLSGQRWPEGRDPEDHALRRQQAWTLWWGGCPVKEIAEMLGVSVATIRIEIRRAAISGEHDLPEVAQRAVTRLR